MIAEKKSTVLWIPVHVLEEMLEKDQGLMYALLLYVCQRGLKDQLYLNCLNYQTIRERIAYWIVGLHNLSPVESVHGLLGGAVAFQDIVHASGNMLLHHLTCFCRVLGAYGLQYLYMLLGGLDIVVQL